MKKYGVFAIALMLTMTLSACRGNNMPDATPGSTDNMPTVITTLPTVGTTTATTENNVPGTSYLPDEDGLIGGTDGTTDNTESSARMRVRR